MTPHIIEEGADRMPLKRFRLYSALAQLAGFRKKQPPEGPDEAAQMEAAFFASYMYEKSN